MNLRPLEPHSSALPKLRYTRIWLRNRDSNPNKQSQSLSCYRYTIPQFPFCFPELTGQRYILYTSFLEKSIPFSKKFRFFEKFFSREITCGSRPRCRRNRGLFHKTRYAPERTYRALKPIKCHRSGRPRPKPVCLPARKGSTPIPNAESCVLPQRCKCRDLRR